MYVFMIFLFCSIYLVAGATGDGRGGGEAVLSLETATLTGEERGGGDKVLSLAVALTVLLSVLCCSLCSLLLLLLSSGSSSSSLALIQFQGNV